MMSRENETCHTAVVTYDFRALLLAVFPILSPPQSNALHEFPFKCLCGTIIM
jgi:hypothetical protein